MTETIAASSGDPHPSERMTRRNRVRHYLLAHTLDDQKHCSNAAASINKFYRDHSAARQSAYHGMKRLKGMKEAAAFLEEKYDRNDQLMKEMKRHERNNQRDSDQLGQISKTMHRHLGSDTLGLPPVWDMDSPAEVEAELMQAVYDTLTDPKWFQYHDEAMILKAKMVKALGAENTVSTGPGM